MSHLAWDDEQDFADADRGFLARLDPCLIRDADGRVVWDNDAYAFLGEDCPPTAHPSLWRQSRLVARQGLYEVVPGIYQVRGLDISHVTFVEGDRGVLVVDPLISTEVAAAALALYREHRGPRPVTAVLYSHSHLDHFGGVRGVVDEADVAAGRIPVIAPAGFLAHAVSENVFTGPAMVRRAGYMYGTTLPKGPAGQIGCGLGQTTSTGSVGLIAPTLDITATGQEEVIDGIRMVFQLTPGTEAPAEMNFHFPERRALCVAENACHTLHNVLTLRGALVRDPSAWARYLTQTLRLFADSSDVVFASHHWPTWGADRAVRFLEEQRDAYAYLHDQSVRMINAGLTGAEIAEELRFPPALERAWHARGYYGTLSHNAKAVYQRYMGWFDGNPAHLWQHPPVAAARRYVEFMGGADAVLAKARQAYEAGDLRWVAEVVNHVIFAEPDHAEARALQADAFEKLGQAAESGPWRNFYLVGAAELRGPVAGSPAHPAPDLLAALTAEQIFQSMAVRLNGPRAGDRRLLLRWEIGSASDSNDPAAAPEIWTLLLSNGALTPMPGDAPRGERPHATLRLARTTLNAVLSGATTFLDEITAGTVTVDGDAGALLAFNSLLDKPAWNFSIVTP
ncbi:MBL fold metallo-hydrolase [Streptomyces sioyaensis]|uniref:Linear primary-alkylsulfatase n=1 Tax=Streptomyces sioyaensis TaxID=67364 RepID=A0A4Q1QT49_9ACTN|nr:alkyl sulfatase dimerization domain-containing protein [Streptomyces sioyaensis]MBM4791918.1 MBL fold metallo-hydrolase [Streptomyces sioyaensis]RXS64916.1 MBL fold metallo-hydrolase [Streptomyces sioyaensis]